MILNYYHPNKYVWDHTDLSVADQAAPNISAEQLGAIRRAIATWDAVLRACFDDQIMLTCVGSRGTADIAVHHVPTAGGIQFGGFAICGAGQCPNIVVPSVRCRRSGVPHLLGSGRNGAGAQHVRRQLRLRCGLVAGP